MNSDEYTPKAEPLKEKHMHNSIFIKSAVSLLSIICACVLIYFIYSPFETTIKNIKQKNYDKAIKITTIGAAIYPFSPKWYSLRGYARFYKKDYNGAIKDFDKAYQLENDEYKMMNFDNKIYIKYYLKDFNNALKDFDKEIDKSQNDYDKDSILWDKAQFLFNIGQYKPALEIYNQLLINSNSDMIFLLQNRLYFERSQVYKKLGREDLAKQDLENAERLNLESAFENPIPEPVLLLDEGR